ncbi:hypothetical protein [Undibacterium sp. Ji49W]|uniref:hypothetical protein n=1 Tax=Undibacterium sp. Ji49W TaxID=3413040 RepID=UPI003BF0AB29
MTKFVRGEVPKTRPFQFADLAELLLLVGDYDELSHGDLEAVITQGVPDSDPDEKSDNTDHAVEVNAREQRYIKGCFNHLTYRVNAFDDIYPFEMDQEVLVKKASISQQNYVYLFLLGCSRLGSFNDLKFRQVCAHLFVEIAAQALKKLMSANSKIWIFDANSDDRRSHFTTNLQESLRILAREMSERHDEMVVIQQEPSGDGGLDIVGIHQFPDKGRGYLVFLGQCAAQKDGWPKKTLEPRRLNTIFNFSHQPYNLNFIPVLYRNITGAWVNEVYTADCVIVDRLRIVKTIYQNGEGLSLKVFQKVKSCVDKMASFSG